MTYKFFTRIVLLSLSLLVINTGHANQSMTRTALAATKGLAVQALQTIKAHPKLACTIGALHGIGFAYSAYRFCKYEMRLGLLERKLNKLEQQKANHEKYVAGLQLHDNNNSPHTTAQEKILFNTQFMRAKTEIEKVIKDLDAQITAKKAEIVIAKEACEAADKATFSLQKPGEIIRCCDAIGEKSVSETFNFIKAKLTRKSTQKINFDTFILGSAPIIDYTLGVMLATASGTLGLHLLAQRYQWPKAQLIKNFGIKALKVEGLLLAAAFYIGNMAMVKKILDERDRAAEDVIKKSKSA